MRKQLLLIPALFFFCISLQSQKVIFLHHSTGGAVYSEGNVAAWMANYNAAHAKNYQITERGYPDSPYPWDNYPYDFWNLWVNPASTCNSANPKVECINSLTQNNNVIIFKHCFPGAGIGADEATSSVSSGSKTLANYKLQYRALRAMMDGYPNNKFIVWTLAPLHRNATSVGDAARAKQFVDWVKTTWLTEDGKSHPNIYIFDFWGIVAESNTSPTQGKVNCLKYDYEGDHNGSDSHPNAAANQVAGPLFGQCIVNAIESTTGFGEIKQQKDEVTVYPNPSNGNITVGFNSIAPKGACLSITNCQGKVVYSLKNVRKDAQIDLSFLGEGLYFYSVRGDKTFVADKLIIVK